MTKELVTTIDLSGPFFQRDPAKTFLGNVRNLMEAVAKEGESDVRAQLQSGEGSRRPLTVGGDRVSDHVIGRTHGLSGREWSTHAVISVNNSGLSKAQGMSLMAGASNVERQTHAFRTTARRIRSARAINAAELAKGLE